MKKFKTFIQEMALDIGTSSQILDNADNRKRSFNRSKNDPVIKYDTGANHILVHKKTSTTDDGEKETEYSTNNHNTGESLHNASIVTHNPTEKLPFTHDEQTSVNRQRHGELPKGYGTDFIYNHFKNNNIPLRSADMQFSGGHDMWKRLAHKALDDGHNVYYHDSNQLHKSTKENVNTHLKNYYGWTNAKDNTDYANRHMIISKTDLLGKK